MRLLAILQYRPVDICIGHTKGLELIIVGQSQDLTFKRLIKSVPNVQILAVAGQTRGRDIQ